MSKPTVLITHWVHPEVIDVLTPHCQVVTNSTHQSWPRSHVRELAQEADAMMAFMPDLVDEAFLQGCPRLKIIAAALKGYDNFDVDACTRHGVWFSIVPLLLCGATAELAVGQMIALGRRMLEGDRFMRSGKFVGWQPHLYSLGLLNRTAGIIGMGKLGQAIAQRLAGFEMGLRYYDPVAPVPEQASQWELAAASLEKVLAESDYLVLAVPLQPDTLHLINADTLAQMKPGCILVNPSRGSVVDEQAVSAALDAGHLGGYAADVFEMEDWRRQDRPLQIPDQLLQNLDQTLLTPHLGSAIDDLRRSIALEAAQNILQALLGQTPAGALNQPLNPTACGTSPYQGEVERGFV
jgi:phosphonate dehydrogenase